MYGLLAKPSAFFPKKKFSIPYCGQICDNRFRSIPLKSGLSFPFGIGWAAFGYFMGLCRRFGQQSSPITQRSPLFAGYHEKRGKNSLCKRSNPIDFSGKISYNETTRTIKMRAGLRERQLPQTLCGMKTPFHTTAKAVPAGLLYPPFLILASIFFHLRQKGV